MLPRPFLHTDQGHLPNTLTTACTKEWKLLQAVAGYLSCSTKDVRLAGLELGCYAFAANSIMIVG